MLETKTSPVLIQCTAHKHHLLFVSQSPCPLTPVDMQSTPWFYNLLVAISEYSRREYWQQEI